MSNPGKFFKKKYDDGEYKGELKNDKRHGEGMMRYTKGKFKDEVYVGNWKDDKKDGWGTLKIDRNCFYEGEWEDNYEHGWGKLKYKDGFYEGEWKNGKVHGYGKYTFNNGRTLEGNWKDNKPDGYGISIGENNDIQIVQIYQGVALKGMIKQSNGSINRISDNTHKQNF
tara:strand:+ start:349 stop:855 length:507 start_codon:yes stop_codon:yes gene_type:complete